MMMTYALTVVIVGAWIIKMVSQKEIRIARTIVWNGPMGVSEHEPFHKGTFEIAKIIATSSAYSVVGGGDSVAAINRTGVAKRISHLSTGGGAALELLKGKSLPGIQALEVEK